MKPLFFLVTLILPIFLNAKVPYIPYEQAFYSEPYPFTEIGSLYKDFYEAYHDNDLEETEYLIPPLIHFIWLGSGLPPDAARLIETWKEMHPGWIIKVWTDKDVEPFRLRNKQAFDLSVNFGQKSDIFRYEILDRFGGVYVDVDFECLKPFDSLHKSCEFYAGVTHENDHLYNGLMGAKPGHPLIKACIENLTSSGEQFDGVLIMNQTGPRLLARMFFYMAPICDLGKTALLPPAIFYPIPHWLRDEITEDLKQRFVRPESMCLHYWNKAWLPHDKIPKAAQ